MVGEVVDGAPRARGAAGRWIWIGVVGLLGLMCLLVGPVSAAPFFIASAFLAVPAASRWLTEQGLSRRWRVVIACGLLFGGLMTIGANAPAEKDPGTKPVSDPSQMAAASADNAAVERTRAQDDFITLYRAVISAGAPCDQSVKVLGSAATSGDVVVMYRAAQRGRDECQGASQAIGDLEPPDGLGDVGTDTTSKALEACRNAYNFRQAAMSNAMEIADSQGRASLLAEMEDNLKSGETGVIVCVGLLFDAAGKAGVKSDRLKIAV